MQSSNQELLIGLATVYEAGAKYLRGYSFNNDAQREAQTLEIMAQTAREVACE